MGENASFQCKNIENNLFYSNILLLTQDIQHGKSQANTESNYWLEPNIFSKFVHQKTYTSPMNKTKNQKS